MKKKKDMKFRILDILYILIAVLPLVCGIVIKVLTKPLAEGITITGAQIYFSVPMPLQELVITESQVNSWLVMITVLGVCLYLTHGVSERVITKRQAAAEWIVEATQSMIRTNMGEDKYFGGFPPFIAAIMSLSAVSSLITLIGLYPPTSDLNVVAGWAVLVFILITYYKFKCGPLHYAASFFDPPPLAPLNIISEVATPVSMAFRHYGNILSGSVISVLIAAGLQGLSAIVLGWLPGVLGDIPLLQIGLPAVLSVYFDVFSGCLQAFIFAMLTMLYIASGFAVDDFEALKRIRAEKRAAKQAALENQ